MTRVFNAPPQRLFDASTRPEHLIHWWGGAEGSQLVVCEVDLRPGGAWRFVERSSDGHEYPFKGIYLEVDPPSRLVSTFAFDVKGWSDREVTVTTTFEAWNGGTKLTNTTVFGSVKDLKEFAKSGMERGARQSWERLAAHLGVSSEASSKGSARSSRGELRLERTFKAPVERVWELFTTKEGLESWWGPDGFTTSVKKLSLRPGGPIEYVMTARAAELIQGLKKMGMPASSEARGTFVEVVPRSRLAFSMVADFIPGTDPYEVLQRVEFHPTRAGVRLVVTLERMHNQQWTERSEIGWKMQLRRLAALL
ncbi:MAG: SRPBCC domain-containing protein [Thermoplasmata archaeon]|nr:SRPBCC domain-containing protein [Thermoplasmata archaeon]